MEMLTLRYLNTASHLVCICIIKLAMKANINTFFVLVNIDTALGDEAQTPPNIAIVGTLHLTCVFDL